jgi:hypothetical protein
LDRTTVSGGSRLNQGGFFVASGIPPGGFRASVCGVAFKATNLCNAMARRTIAVCAVL